MLTAQDELQLETELQELYIIASHWLKDFPFFDGEIAFCRKLLLDCPNIMLGDTCTSAACLHARLRSIGGERENLERRVRRHLKAIDPLVRDACRRIEIAVIQDHAALEADLEALQQSIDGVKRQLNSVVDKSLRHVNTANIL